MFRVTPHTVRGWIRRRDLEATKVGRMYLISPAQLQAFIDARLEETRRRQIEWGNTPFLREDDEEED